MTPRAATALERLRAIALALPDADEKLSHGMPAFLIRKGRMFAYFWHHHHGDDVTAAIVKTSGIDEQESLIAMDPDLYFRPAYFGPSGWVGIHLDGADLDWDRVGDRVAISWELVAPRRLLEAGGR
ncbi:MmcQ/YjbR family DNA-binding protein [Sphingomonas sp.]|uniref:MmcQ/YjbR family DNA-binding protein n=1 Tax=Sphingomonas sp. TaxID=28214 RepID=UPI001ECD2F10|nr:MmcQ/YjbR family DNA-binding protein [Sphingomonas sp.]MBX3595144.1 MmcQ/YjbR family DNA-binding protein [Sphingomonas sp.]